MGWPIGQAHVRYDGNVLESLPAIGRLVSLSLPIFTLARFAKFNLCALPMTLFLLMPIFRPIFSVDRLPSIHNIFSYSIFSIVHGEAFLFVSFSVIRTPLPARAAQTALRHLRRQRPPTTPIPALPCPCCFPRPVVCMGFSFA